MMAVDKMASVTAKKREAVQMLRDIEGVGGIGVGWDRDGHQVLQVELQPGTDRKLVEQHLSQLDVPFVLQMVRGFAKTM
jgi:hypothetical protein